MRDESVRRRGRFLKILYDHKVSQFGEMSDRMPKIDFDKIKKSDLDFIREIERKNQERVQKLKFLRRRNLLTAGLLTAGIFSIYGYSMLAVKQETFLDDFEEPAKTSQAQ